MPNRLEAAAGGNRLDLSGAKKVIEPPQPSALVGSSGFRSASSQPEHHVAAVLLPPEANHLLPTSISGSLIVRQDEGNG